MGLTLSVWKNPLFYFTSLFLTSFHIAFVSIYLYLHIKPHAAYVASGLTGKFRDDVAHKLNGIMVLNLNSSFATLSFTRTKLHSSNKYNYRIYSNKCRGAY